MTRMTKIFPMGILLICVLALFTGPAAAELSVDFADVIGPGPQYYGSNLYWTDEDVDLIQDRIDKSNMNIMRLSIMQFLIENPNDNTDPNSINWEGFDFESGIDYFGKTVGYSRIIEKLKELDIYIMVVIPYLSPWLSANYHEPHDMCGTYPPSSYEEYEEFVYAVLYHMVNNVGISADKIILEPFNEPDLGCGQDPSVRCFWKNHHMDDTVDTFLTAYNAAKSVSPFIRVVGMAEWDDGRYVRDFINNHDGLTYLDGITYHKYSNNYDISALVSMGARFIEDYDIPVFVDEYGSRTWGSDGPDGALWHSYALTYLLRNGIHPLQHPFLEFPGLGEPYESMGLFFDWRNNWQIKESFWLYSNILRFMKDTDILNADAGDQNLDVIAGKRNGEINIVITNRDSMDKDITVAVHNFSGNYLNITVYDNFQANHVIDSFGVSGDRFEYVMPSRRSVTINVAASAENSPPVADDQLVTTREDTSSPITLTASDLDGDPLTYNILTDPANGTLSGTAPDITYTPNAHYTGADSFTYQANDGQADSNIATVTVTVTAATIPQLEFGTLTAGADYVTVILGNTYISPVVVCSVQYNNNTTPVVPRLTDVTPIGFNLRLQNPSGGAVAPENVSYLVVEEGAWTIDGVNIEAQTYLSTVTDENNSWVAEPQKYMQSYTNPVVLGQVMTENDTRWSVFWCHGSTRTKPPSATALKTGKTVCEDIDVTRADETVGFIVFESGHGRIGGVEFEAALGADTVMDVTNSPPYTYSFQTPFTSAPRVAVVTMAGVDGANGGWAYVHGSTLATATSLYLSIDEDQIKDSERNHTTEQVGYVVFGNATANDPPVANNQTVTTSEDAAVSITLTASDVNGDPLSYTIISPPSHGTLDGIAAEMIYTPDPDRAGTDSFTYQANDGQADSNTATVTITVIAVNDAPVATNDDYSMYEGQSLTTDVPGVLGNDNDVEGDTLTAFLFSGPTNGVLTLNADGSFAYSSDVAFSGIDSFTYQANDGDLNSNIATVTITVENSSSTNKEIYVNDIEVSKRRWWVLTFGTARVHIVDNAGLPVEGANITGQWSGGANDIDQFPTGPDGWGTTDSNRRWRDATFTFCVTSVSKEDSGYDPDSNIVTCGNSE